MTRPKAKASVKGAEANGDVAMQDAAAVDGISADASATTTPSAAMQRAVELTQRRVNLEEKLRAIDHMVRADVAVCHWPAWRSGHHPFPMREALQGVWCAEQNGLTHPHGMFSV